MPVQSTAQPIIKTMPHNITISDRTQLCATGVIAIVSYDSFAATLETPLGQLVVGGQNITVSELSTQTGEVKINGNIEFLQYSAPKEKGASFLKRLVR